MGWELSTAVANVDTATGYQAAGLPVDSKQGPLAKGTGLLTELYADFVTNQSVTAGSRSQALGLGDGLLQMINDRVLTSIRYSGSSSALEQSLVATGATIESRLDFAPVIEVWLPISQLMSIAERDEVESITPVYAGTTSKQGIADNQADRVSRTDVLRTQSGLTGQGVTVGVISDSANRFGSGLAGSVASGDLPPDVTLLRDRFSKSDEGRAMMEEVYDIAPAASLKFADWGSSMSDFATSVDQLRLNGADVIVDDIRYWAEPMFQPGVIDRAITRAVNAGISYFSSAGNSGPGGYEDYFYLVDSNGTKRQDFLRGSGVDTFLRVYIPNNAKPLILQWSEPYDGVTGSANSDVDIYIYDTAGSLRAKGVDNNLQNHIPMELVPLSGLPTGYYDIRIVLYATQSGESAPAEFKFVKEDLQVLEHTGGTVIVSSAYGHSVGPNTIGVGAVPFFNAAPYSTTTPVQNDWFSAYGKPVYYFDENFGELASPKVYQSPQVSGVDGVNTSFFGSDTTRDSDTLPNFFGTSAAAPMPLPLRRCYWSQSQRLHLQLFCNR